MGTSIGFADGPALAALARGRRRVQRRRDCYGEGGAMGARGGSGSTDVWVDGYTGHHHLQRSNRRRRRDSTLGAGGGVDAPGDGHRPGAEPRHLQRRPQCMWRGSTVGTRAGCTRRHGGAPRRARLHIIRRRHPRREQGLDVGVVLAAPLVDASGWRRPHRRHLQHRDIVVRRRARLASGYVPLTGHGRGGSRAGQGQPCLASDGMRATRATRLRD
mmetsp:Transcript_83869/g.234036  ORF Transcript_83869/g.234036 Transcript_83869/m.234036 type:complete len:216 (-) Transcript_83869:1064-1711(-)